jgi:D-threo-aldose 1-dehydrogenase
LHYLATRARERVIERVLECGIRHFDTAPAYGDGLAEFELGRYLAHRRPEITIATKYGISPSRICLMAEQIAPVAGFVARFGKAAFRRIPGVRRPQESVSVGKLRESFFGSLRRLRTDMIDIFFLHEPDVYDLDTTKALLNELWTLRQKGYIRAFGVAASFDRVRELVERCPDLCQVIQTSEAEWRDFPVPDITYGAIARGPQSWLSAGGNSRDAPQKILSALARRPNGAAIFASTKPENISAVAKAVSYAS